MTRTTRRELRELYGELLETLQHRSLKDDPLVRSILNDVYSNKTGKTGQLAVTLKRWQKNFLKWQELQGHICEIDAIIVQIGGNCLNGKNRHFLRRTRGNRKEITADGNRRLYQQITVAQSICAKLEMHRDHPAKAEQLHKRMSSAVQLRAIWLNRFGVCKPYLSWSDLGLADSVVRRLKRPVRVMAVWRRPELAEQAHSDATALENSVRPFWLKHEADKRSHCSSKKDTKT